MYNGVIGRRILNMTTNSIDIIHYQTAMSLFSVYESSTEISFASYIRTFPTEQLEFFLESIAITRGLKIDSYYLIDLSSIETHIKVELSKRQ